MRPANTHGTVEQSIKDRDLSCWWATCFQQGDVYHCKVTAHNLAVVFVRPSNHETPTSCLRPSHIASTSPPTIKESPYDPGESPTVGKDSNPTFSCFRDYSAVETFDKFWICTRIPRYGKRCDDRIVNASRPSSAARNMIMCPHTREGARRFTLPLTCHIVTGKNRQKRSTQATEKCRMSLEGKWLTNPDDPVLPICPIYISFSFS